MSFRSIAVTSALLCCASIMSSAQASGPATTSFANLSLHVPPGTVGFWGRYVVVYGSTGTAGWITRSSSADAYSVQRISPGPHTHVKALLYAPGCSLQPMDIPIEEARQYDHVFQCEPLPSIQIQGAMTRLDRLYGHGVTIEAAYTARWAPAFFGYEDGTVTKIPLGAVTSLNADNRFRLSIPDLAKDPLADDPAHPGEIQIWARDTQSGRLIAQLRLSPQHADLQPTRLGGFPIASLVSRELVFIPCAVNPPSAHDSSGFSLRPDAVDACGPDDILHTIGICIQ